VENDMTKRILVVLWPSFLVACIAETLFFASLDPREFHLGVEVVDQSGIAVYSIFFLLFWAVGAGSSALTSYLAPPSSPPAPPSPAQNH
jgi:hypothetical protein